MFSYFFIFGEKYKSRKIKNLMQRAKDEALANFYSSVCNVENFIYICTLLKLKHK